MDRQSVDRNIRLYYWFQLLREPLFWGPIMISYMQKAGNISLEGLYFMEAVCTFLIMVLEVPTGALADIIGRRITVLCGSVAVVIECVLFASVDSVAMIWASNLAWVLSASLFSGADTSLLYDTLAAAGREKEFRRIQGRAHSGRLALMAVTSLAAGYLAEVHLRLPVALSVLPVIGAVLSVYYMREPIQLENYSADAHWGRVREGFTHVLKSKRILWVIGMMVFVGVISKVWFFTYNPYFELAGLSYSAFGWIFFFLSVVAAMSSFAADKIVSTLGEKGSAALIVLTLSLPIMVMGWTVLPIFAWLTLFQNIARGLFRPFLGQIMHDELSYGHRATVDSIGAAVGSGAMIIGLAGFGWLLSIYHLSVCLIALGALALATGTILVLSMSHVFNAPLSKKSVKAMEIVE